MFEIFQKTLETKTRKDIETIKQTLEEINQEKLKSKESEISSLNKRIKEAEAERAKIREETTIEVKKEYELKMAELNKKANSTDKRFEDLEKMNGDLNARLATSEDKRLKANKEHMEETDKLRQEFEAQIRKLENKTPGELGEEGQAEVIEVLKKTFSRTQDDIIETKKGKKGSDIFHKVYHNGKQIALIIYEVKNVSNWDNDFIRQVKDDISAHSANYGLLVSNILPPKEKLICKKDEVMIIHPSKVEIIAKEIRHFLIEAHKAKLSNEEIEDKMRILQEYFTSPDYKNSIIDLVRAIKSWNDLRFAERSNHEKHWAAEEKLNNTIQEKTAKIHSKINSIIEAELQPLQLSVKKKKKNLN